MGSMVRIVAAARTEVGVTAPAHFHGFGAGTLIRHGGQQLHQLVLQSRVFIAHAVVEHGVKPGVPLAYRAEQGDRGIHRLAEGGR